MCGMETKFRRILDRITNGSFPTEGHTRGDKDPDIKADAWGGQWLEKAGSTGINVPRCSPATMQRRKD